MPAGTLKVNVPGVLATGVVVELKTDEVTTGCGGGVWSATKWHAWV